MKNTLSALNNHLFAQLERLGEEDLDEDEIKKEVQRSKAITDVAKVIVDNGRLALQTMKHMDEYGYIEIKTEESNVWKLKQKVVWEAVNGPVPDGFKLIFLDGNKENVSIENLEMVSNDEMLEMNRKGLRYDDPESTKTGILIAKVNRAAAKLQKGKENMKIQKMKNSKG